MNKKNIKLILSFLIMFFCAGISEVRAEETVITIPLNEYENGGVKIIVDSEGNIKQYSLSTDQLFPIDERPFSAEDAVKIVEYSKKNNEVPPVYCYTSIMTIDCHAVYDDEYAKIYDQEKKSLWWKNFLNALTKHPMEIIVQGQNGSIAIKGDNLPDQPVTPPAPIGGCDIIPQEVIEFLNEVFNIFKILVPIIIVSFGILDFSKGVFGGDENEIKKAQGKFIKRLIIGIIFFFIPLIMTLVFDLINKGWGTCGVG